MSDRRNKAMTSFSRCVGIGLLHADKEGARMTQRLKYCPSEVGGVAAPTTVLSGNKAMRVLLRLADRREDLGESVWEDTDS